MKKNIYLAVLLFLTGVKMSYIKILWMIFKVSKEYI